MPRFIEKLLNTATNTHSTNKLPEVRKLFADYLDYHKQRKTAERFSILEEIYNRNDHFDVDLLYNELKKKKLAVSRATVYNTLDLLVECGLVVRHQFGSQQSMYEKSYGFRQHDHLICNECKKVFEFCDPRVSEIQNMMGKLLHFDIQQHSLILYGNCRVEDCQRKNA